MNVNYGEFFRRVYFIIYYVCMGAGKFLNWIVSTHTFNGLRIHLYVPTITFWNRFRLITILGKDFYFPGFKIPQINLIDFYLIPAFSWSPIGILSLNGLVVWFFYHLIRNNLELSPPDNSAEQLQIDINKQIYRDRVRKEARKLQRPKKAIVKGVYKQTMSAKDRAYLDAFMRGEL